MIFSNRHWHLPPSLSASALMHEPDLSGLASRIWLAWLRLCKDTRL
jgi:hypothetical protein